MAIRDYGILAVVMLLIDQLVSKTKLGPLKNWISSISMNPSNEHQFVTSCYDGSCKVWDLRSRTSLYTLQQDEAKLFTVDWNTVIATGGENSKINIYQS